MDEARVGQQGTLTRVWAPQGTPGRLDHVTVERIELNTARIQGGLNIAIREKHESNLSQLATSDLMARVNVRLCHTGVMAHRKATSGTLYMSLM